MRAWTLGILALVIALVACGGGVVRPRERFALPVRRSTFGRVDVGGYELAWMCQGEGSPTIIAEAGYDSAGTSTYFESMGPMSAISRVCTYDRAGTGTSDHRPAGLHVTSLLQAKELHALLEGAAIDASVRRRRPFVRRLRRSAVRGHVPGRRSRGSSLIDSSHEDEVGPYRRYYGNSPEGDWVDGGDLIDIDATRRALA